MFTLTHMNVKKMPSDRYMHTVATVQTAAGSTKHSNITAIDYRHATISPVYLHLRKTGFMEYRSKL